MKKLTLIASSILGSVFSFFGQDYWPSIPVPDSLNPFLSFPENSVEIADIDDDGIEDVLFYNRDSLSFRHLKGLGNGQFEEIPSDQSILKAPFNAVLNFVSPPFLSSGDSIYWEQSLENFTCYFADIDNEGDVDLIISADFPITSKYISTCYSYYYDGLDQRYLVFEKNSMGAFESSNPDSELLQATCFGRDMAFMDFDSDGDIDILKSSYQWGPYGLSAFTGFYEFDDVTNEFESNGGSSVMNINGNYEFDFYTFMRVHDLNHDGVDDLWNGEYIRFGNGLGLATVFFNFEDNLALNASFSPGLNLGVGTSNLRYRTDLGDFENDGFSEWLVYDQNQWKLFSQKCSLGINGQECLDFDPCSENETFDEDCNCSGPESDSDLDGLCDELDLTNGDCVLNEPCDDGDDCTYSEHLDENCECIGTAIPDDDNDGICNALDQCPGEDDLIDENLNGIPDCLEYPNDADFEDATDPITGLSEIEQAEKKIRVYPNPSEGIFTIDSELSIQHLALFNAMGEEVPLFLSGQNQIDLSHLSKGMYTLLLKTEEGILRKKLIKE